MLNKSFMFLAFLLAFTFHGSRVFAADEPGVVTAFDGEQLAAKWTIPAAEVKLAVVIVQGSGNVGSDGDVSSPQIGAGYRGQPAKISDQLANTLASAGVASIRYDKRGFANPAQLKNQTIEYLVRDASSAVAAVRSRFPKAKVGIVGFSEGALVATLVASAEPIDELFLLSLPTRSIDDSLDYIAVEWPLDLLKARLKHIGEDELEIPASPLPLFGFEGAKLDADHNGRLSITKELTPAYAQLLQGVLQAMASPPFDVWYNSLKRVPPFRELAARVTSQVFIYQAMEDTQNHWSWAVAAAPMFTANKGRTKLRTFAGLGHCFSPFEGELGQIKTSGPLDFKLLETLARDAKQ